MNWLKEIIAKEGGGYLLSRGRLMKDAIRWGDMDAMRHVNNVVYLKKYEAARIEYLLDLEQRHNKTKQFLSGTGVGPIMRRADISWKYPVTYPDTISILSKVEKVEHDRFYLNMILVSHNAEKLASRIRECEVTVDYSKEPTAKTAVPDLWREIFRKEFEAQANWESEFD